MIIPLPKTSWAWSMVPASPQHDEVLLETERLTEPLDGRRGIPVPQGRNDRGRRVLRKSRHVRVSRSNAGSFSEIRSVRRGCKALAEALVPPMRPPVPDSSGGCGSMPRTAGRPRGASRLSISSDDSLCPCLERQATVSGVPARGRITARGHPARRFDADVLTPDCGNRVRIPATAARGRRFDHCDDRGNRDGGTRNPGDRASHAGREGAGGGSGGDRHPRGAGMDR